MTTPRRILATPVERTDWAKRTRLVREGFGDLVYLPRGRVTWNMTLAALAYSARRLVREQIDHRPALSADLNLWAAMHGAPPSASYEQLGKDALVLWHGTSAVRAEKIREHGLKCRGGVWATTEPRIAHSFTRGRSRAFQAGSAMICLVLDKNAWDGPASLESDRIVQFHNDIAPELVEYILSDDRIDFVGAAKARTPKSWGVARFKKRSGKWLPVSKSPVRLDAGRSYSDLPSWLDVSIERIMATLGCAAASEIFSSLYATLGPWDALPHRQVFDAIDRLCQLRKRAPNRTQLFGLRP